MTNDLTIQMVERRRTSINRWLWIIFGALLLLAIVYLVRGFGYLIFRSEPSDLYQRWQETRRVLSGRNPYLNEPWGSPYPPNAFLSLLLFVWPPRRYLQIYFAAINGICLAFIADWAASGEGLKRPEKWVLAVATLAVAGTCTALGVGQTSVIGTAAIVGTMLLAEREEDYAAGLVFGIALLKPTIAGLFIIPLLFRKRFRLFIVATVYTLLGMTLVLVHTHTWPLDVLRTWRAMSVHGDLRQGTAGLINVFKSAGITTELAMMVIGVIATVITVAAQWVLRRRSLPVAFAIVSVGARLWSYHSVYDNIMLVFLLVALGMVALRTTSIPVIVAFAAVGVSLWIPAKWSDHQSIALIQIIIWIGGGVVLANWTRDVNDPATMPRGKSVYRSVSLN